MFGFVLGLLARPVVASAVGLAVLVQAYALLGPEDEQFGFAGRTLAGRTAATVVADLPDRQGVATLAVLPLRNDPDGVLARRIREEVTNRGRYVLVEESFVQRVLREVRGQPLAPSTLEDAVRAARRIGADAVLFGDVGRFSTEQGDARIGLDLRMVERDSGQAVFGRRYEDRIEPSPVRLAYWRARLADSSKIQRVALWILLALLLPLAAARLIRRVLEEESNTRNALLVLALTAVNGLLAWGLTGFWLPTGWSVLVVLLAVVTGAMYNYKVATVIDELRR